MKRLVLISSLLVAGSLGSFAQEGTGSESSYNKYSTKNIHESDIMWKKEIIRAVDLREKQNLPLFAYNQEISRLLLEAVEEGVLTPYKNDSLAEGTVLTMDEFKTNLAIPGLTGGGDDESEDDWGGDSGDDWGDSGDDWGDSGDDWGDDGGSDDSGDSAGDDAIDLSTAVFYEPRQLYQLEINENLLFDNQRSVLYYDIISITLFVPADEPDNIKGYQVPVATFSFKELVENVFEGNPAAIWYNPYNDQEHRNLADAFELRLFSSYIVKVSNPENEFIVDTYGGDLKTGIMASQWKQFELLEYEHNLWEF